MHSSLTLRLNHIPCEVIREYHAIAHENALFDRCTIPDKIHRRFSVYYWISSNEDLLNKEHIDRRKSKAIDVIQTVLLKLQSRTRANVWARRRDFGISDNNNWNFENINNRENVNGKFVANFNRMYKRFSNITNHSLRFPDSNRKDSFLYSIIFFVFAFICTSRKIIFPYICKSQIMTRTSCDVWWIKIIYRFFSEKDEIVPIGTFGNNRQMMKNASRRWLSKREEKVTRLW